MRWLITVLVACGHGHTEVVLPDASDPHVFARLDMNVVWSPQRLLVFAREPDRPCTCTAGEFPALEACLGNSDAITCTCTPPPASCLASVSILNGNVSTAAAAL